MIIIFFFEKKEVTKNQDLNRHKIKGKMMAGILGGWRIALYIIVNYNLFLLFYAAGIYLL